MATPGPDWTLPKLRVDRHGDWYEGDVEITHPGILANLRSNLRRDAEGYYIQTRVRIPVQVEDVPWVVTRVEVRGDRLHAVLNDGSEEPVDPATLGLRGAPEPAGDLPAPGPRRARRPGGARAPAGRARDRPGGPAAPLLTAAARGRRPGRPWRAGPARGGAASCANVRPRRGP